MVAGVGRVDHPSVAQVDRHVMDRRVEEQEVARTQVPAGHVAQHGELVGHEWGSATPARPHAHIARPEQSKPSPGSAWRYRYGTPSCDLAAAMAAAARARRTRASSTCASAPSFAAQPYAARTGRRRWGAEPSDAEAVEGDAISEVTVAATTDATSRPRRQWPAGGRACLRSLGRVR